MFEPYFKLLAVLTASSQRCRILEGSLTVSRGRGLDERSLALHANLLSSVSVLQSINIQATQLILHSVVASIMMRRGRAVKHLVKSPLSVVEQRMKRNSQDSEQVSDPAIIVFPH